jgi:D-alanine-D-alanine ligase
VKVLVLFDMGRPATAGETFSPRVLKEEEDKQTEADVLSCLTKLGHQVETLAVFNDVVSIVEKLKEFTPDVVFNLTESFHSNRAHEPNIPALLELMRARYTGARPDGIILCKDKALAKKVLLYHRLRVPHFVISQESRPLKRLRRFVFPAFVKPVSEESSDGIAKASFAKSEEEALERARFIHEKFQCDALIEEYIEGRELYVSVMGNSKLTVFPPREIFFEQMPEDEPKFATFKAKWDDAYRKKWGIKNGPARELPSGLQEKLTRIARKVYRVLKIQGLGRIDVRLTSAGEIVIIEANPNPSLAREEDFAQSAAAAGVDYEQLIQRILDTAGG